MVLLLFVCIFGFSTTLADVSCCVSLFITRRSNNIPAANIISETSAVSRGRSKRRTSSFRRALILEGAVGCWLLQPRQLHPGSKFPTSVSSGSLPACRPLLGRTSSDMTSIVCRVQYLDDSDPFICTNFPEPRRPPAVSLEEDVPLSEQVAGLHKLLEAPLKVGQSRSGSREPGIRDSVPGRL